MPLEESKTVLLVDDEAGILDAYMGFLSPADRPLRRSARVEPDPAAARPQPETRLDYTFVTATSGEQAIGIVEATRAAGGRVACGFFDMKMPGGIDGLETIRRIRAIDGQVLCTIVTAHQDRSIAEINALFAPDHLDEWDYLSKPFTKWEVIQKCRQMVASWNRRRREEAQLAENAALAQELAEWGRTLEARVEVRTAELEDANRALGERNERLRAVLQELQLAQAQVVHAEKMSSIGQLAAGVAHEVNNPVGFVHSNLGSLAKYVGRIAAWDEHVRRRVLPGLQPGPEGEAIRESIERTRRDLRLDYILQDLPELVQQSMDGTERIRRIVQNLRTFSHPGSDEHRPEDVNEGLRRTLELAGAALRRTADLDVRLGELPPVTCNPSELSQVWLNLIINASHALEGRAARGRVEVTTACEDDQVVVRVRDNGCGMTPEVAARIFEPFYTTKEVGKGTGLGLSVAYGIVKRHGGEITVESTPGEGTCFSVRLPAAVAVAGAAT